MAVGSAVVTALNPRSPTAPYTSAKTLTMRTIPRIVSAARRSVAAVLDSF